MVHNSKHLIQSLEAFIGRETHRGSATFEVSDVKRDGTVFVRFRSTALQAAHDSASAFVFALIAHGLAYTCVEDEPTKFRVDIAQFAA